MQRFISEAGRQRHREWLANGGPARAAARRLAQGGDHRFPALRRIDATLERLVREKLDDPHRRDMELLQRDRDQFVIKTRRLACPPPTAPCT
jgi:hypothetical protein